MGGVGGWGYRKHRFVGTIQNRWRRFGAAVVGVSGRLGTFVRRIGIVRL